MAATLEDRAGKFKGAVFEIRSIKEEFSMQSIGGMMAAKILLERALLPSLFLGSCNWTGVKTGFRCLSPFKIGIHISLEQSV